MQRTASPSIYFMLFCDLFLSAAAASTQNEDPPHTFLVGAVILLDFHTLYLDS